VEPPPPPAFASIADDDVKHAFIGRGPEIVISLGTWILFIGGKYQTWIPGLSANDTRRISLLPHLKPNSQFNAR
jgi:hypothetical protein